MPEQCDICGIAALESEHFAEEAIPFVRSKRYCPACRQQLYRRVFALLALVPVVFGIAGIFLALKRNVSLLDSTAVQWSLLLIFQWVMILPHELGHAVVGRVIGFRQTRIFVGSGKMLFAFNLFGIPTLINLIPFGGVTLAEPPNSAARWRYLVFVGGGLLINLAAAAIAWCYMASRELLSIQAGTVVIPFFWANILLFAENLFPHQVHTPFGLLNSDGLQLWNVLFRWNKPLTMEPVHLNRWSLGLRYLLKWTAILATVIGAGLFLLAGSLPFFEGYGGSGWELTVVWVAMMFALALVTGWAAVRIFKNPVVTVAKPQLPAAFRQSFSLPDDQNQFLRQALGRAEQNDYGAAEALLDRVFAGVDSNAAGYWPLVLLKLEYVISQNDMARAEKFCLDLVSRAPTTELKVRILDNFASQILYKSALSGLDSAERLVRDALELAPRSLTLKGTLGGILVERGRFAEAEPLLRACLERSPALHDQGVSALYLGIAKLNRGDRREARRLIKRAMVLHCQPWLLSRAEAVLKELGR